MESLTYFDINLTSKKHIQEHTCASQLAATSHIVNLLFFLFISNFSDLFFPK